MEVAGSEKDEMELMRKKGRRRKQLCIAASVVVITVIVIIAVENTAGGKLYEKPKTIPAGGELNEMLTAVPASFFTANSYPSTFSELPYNISKVGINWLPPSSPDQLVVLWRQVGAITATTVYY
jgi:hypothetical protein